MTEHNNQKKLLKLSSSVKVSSKKVLGQFLFFSPKTFLKYIEAQSSIDTVTFLLFYIKIFCNRSLI